MFCACPITYRAAPNSAVCPVCLGHPGALPVVNDHAVALAVRAGLAVGCTINDASVFSRKHYFYPDLPKGYQITQFDKPICSGGALHILVDGSRHRFEIERIHLEEDAGKLTHHDDHSLIDFNRGGTPLVEVVGRPDLSSADAAEAWMRMLHRVMVTAGVTLGDMEKGHFRCDANVSLAPKGGPLGARVELKNINSFRFLNRAINHEIARQREILGQGGRIDQTTRGWADGESHPMRSKEDAADYRYFPCPDLGPLPVTEADHISAEAALEATPLDRYLLDQDDADFSDFQSRYGLSKADAMALRGEAHFRAHFEQAVAEGGAPKDISNWVLGAFARWSNAHPSETALISPADTVSLVSMIDVGTITRDVAKAVFEILCQEGGDAQSVIASRGWSRLDDTEAIAVAVDAVLAAHPAELARCVAGESKLMGFFIGAVMREFQGRADAKTVRALLLQALSTHTYLQDHHIFMGIFLSPLPKPLRTLL